MMSDEETPSRNGCKHSVEPILHVCATGTIGMQQFGWILNECRRRYLLHVDDSGHQLHGHDIVIFGMHDGFKFGTLLSCQFAPEG